MQRKYTTLSFTEFTVQAFDNDRRPISQIIIHSTVSTVQAAISTFSSKNAKTSTHYIIGNDGKLFAGLEEYYVAYHSGDYTTNQRSVGIEHEWYQGLIPSDALYKKSAALVADICKFYGLGINRGVIKGHKEIVPTACPNQIDVDRIVKEAQVSLNPCQTYIDQNSLKDKVIGERDLEIVNLKKKMTELQSKIDAFQNEMTKQLSLKDSECKQKLQDIKSKVLNLANSL